METKENDRSAPTKSVILANQFEGGGQDQRRTVYNAHDSLRTVICSEELYGAPRMCGLIPNVYELYNKSLTPNGL